MTFAPGAVAQSITVTITQSGTSYDLKAVDASGATVETFAVPPVLTITYDPSGPAPSTIYYVDPVNGLTPVSSTVDPVLHTISAALQHFSDYTTGDKVTTTLSAIPPAGTAGTPIIVTAHVVDTSNTAVSNAQVIFTPQARTRSARRV